MRKHLLAIYYIAGFRARLWFLGLSGDPVWIKNYYKARYKIRLEDQLHHLGFDII